MQEGVKVFSRLERFRLCRHDRGPTRQGALWRPHRGFCYLDKARQVWRAYAMPDGQAKAFGLATHKLGKSKKGKSEYVAWSHENTSNYSR